MVRGTLRLRAAITAVCLLTGTAICAGYPAMADAAEAEPGSDATALALAEPKSATPGAAPHKPTRKAATTTLDGDTTRTRFLIGLDSSVDFSVLALNNPNRVVVELPDVPLRLPADPGDNAVGLVKSFRAGLSGPGKNRIVIDVTEPVVVDNSRIEKTPDGAASQLVLEIVPAASVVKSARKPLKTPPFALGAAGLQPPLPKPAKRPAEIAGNAYKPIIVIDPGHGGDDTGAVKNGAVEKDVVLAFAHVLRKKIEATGRYKVLMTRDTDKFIPLDERRAFGERNKAALFIAVHADYASTSARGATIYSLRENVANSLKRSAKGEVSEHVLSANEISAVKKASGEADDVSAVRDILSDLAEREVEATQERTNIFSRSVIENMGETTNLRQKPDQQAAFRVLKTAQFPSVLIELAYVTNKEDAALLKSDAWREKVADSISTAVENYFSHQIARLPM